MPESRPDVAFAPTALLSRLNSIFLDPIFFCTILFSITGAFVAGYAFRMRGRWPSLQRFQRSEYAQVWDALSSTPKNAEAAASGMTGESALRTSGAEIARRIAAAASITEASDVLEIGCGVGRVGWAMAPLSRSWTGCDISARMAAHARHRLAGVSNARVVHLRASGLREIEETSMDVVYCTNALPHLDQTERWLYVKEAYRVLRPGGRLHIDTVEFDSVEGWAMIENNLAQRTQGVNPPYAPTPSTPDELLTYYKRAGFSTSRIERYGSLVAAIAFK